MTKEDGVKDPSFYSEIVIVTILSLASANSWIRVLNTLVKTYNPGLKIQILIALGLTCISIFVLWFAFKNLDAKEQQDEKIIRPIHLPETDEIS